MGLTDPKFQFQRCFSYYRKQSTVYILCYILTEIIPSLAHLSEPQSDENGLPGCMSFGWLQVLPPGEQQASQLVFHENRAKYPENLQNEALSSQLVGW